ncbi:MAG: amidohydrolase [Betaproteobacteria bacterium]|nr:amidohydrolase [Betaproteobacteria bacterium]
MTDLGASSSGLILSSDSHVIEPPALWLERVPPKYAEQAPRVLRHEDADYWYVAGERSNSFAGGAQAGQRFVDRESLRSAARFEDVRPGGYDPAAHLAENLEDGIHGSVLYPTVGLLLFGVRDLALLHAICRAYNDWLAAFCRHDPSRLKGVAMIPLDDLEFSINELERCRRMDLAGAMISCAPLPDQRYGSAQDRFWSAAQSLDVPLSLHIATDRSGADFSEAGISNADHSVRQSLADLIFTGVLHRYPKLRIGVVEYELAWIPFFLDRMDYTFTQRAARPGWSRERLRELPSHYFRQNVFVSFQEDALGIRDRGLIGLEGLMFGSDYPHTESTFPRSRQILGELLAGVPSDEHARLTWGNCARLYGFAPV